MKIAQVAPLFESVPPKLYGGTERVVSYLTEELVRQGHEVTLFASADSKTSAHLRPCAAQALRLSPGSPDPIIHHLVMVERVYKEIHRYDIVHFHIDYFHFPLCRQIKANNVTTLHGRLDLPDMKFAYQEYPEIPVISISNSQRNPLPHINWKGTVYNGIPAGQMKFAAQPGDYLAFIGRISPEKGPERAIEIAARAGIPLKIAAKVDKADREYFEKFIEPLLHREGVEYIGEINEHEKNDFLGNALALLFPIDWPEPFGLAMIESMACGTPVIAFNRGSVPEIMKDGVSGYIVNSIDEAVAALRKIHQIDRQACRTHFERYFTAEKMALNYLAVYQRICQSNKPSHKALMAG